MRFLTCTWTQRNPGLLLKALIQIEPQGSDCYGSDREVHSFHRESNSDGHDEASDNRTIHQ